MLYRRGEKISFDGRKKSGYRIKFSEYVVHSSLLKKGDCIRFGNGRNSKQKKRCWAIVSYFTFFYFHFTSKRLTGSGKTGAECAKPI